MIEEWECWISNFGAMAVLIKDWIQGMWQSHWQVRRKGSLEVEEDTVQARVWNEHPQALQSLQKVGVQGKPRNLLRHILDEGGTPARCQTTVEEQWSVQRSSGQLSGEGGVRGSDTRWPGSISGNKDSPWPHLQTQRSRHVREGKCLGDRLQGKGRNFQMRLHT